MKVYTTFLKFQGMEPHHQNTLGGGDITSLQRCKWYILLSQPTLAKVICLVYRTVPFPVSRYGRIHRRHFCRGVIPPRNESPGYDTKQSWPSRLVLQNKPTASLQSDKTSSNDSPDYDIKQCDGEVPVILELSAISEYPFIVIAPRSTLARSGISW